MNSRHRSYCFTVNNYTEEDIVKLNSIECKYIIFGKEIAPTTETKHLQGYVQFSQGKSFTQIQEWLPAGTHIEVAKGSPAQNIAYCSKGDDYLERGERPEQGKRSDIKDFVEEMKRTTLEDAALKFTDTYVKYPKAFRDINYYHTKAKLGRRDKMRTVIWIWGRPGSGKSKWVLDSLPVGKRVWYDSGAHDFFDNYSGEEIAVFDDLYYNTKNIKDLLRATDPWSNPVLNAKGTQTAWTADYVFITSTESPQQFMLHIQDQPWQQMTRRVTVCHEIKAPDTIPPFNFEQPIFEETLQPEMLLEDLNEM